MLRLKRRQKTINLFFAISSTRMKFNTDTLFLGPAILLVTWWLSDVTGHQHVAHPSGTGGLDSNMVHDAGHIKEHYEGMAEFDESKLSPEELEFHYFKLHDYNNDTRLDGLEIYKALTHMLPFEEAEESEKHAQIKDPQKRKEVETQYYTDIVDQVLREDDFNNDGYLTYPEYILARRKQEVKDARDAAASKATSSKN